MGVPVTVDSDDLEALILGTAALRDIDVALATARNDPAVQGSKPKLAAAHDRISNAWRGTLREKRFPERFTEATPAEVKEIAYLADHGASLPGGAEFVRPQQYRSLMVRGFIEYGIPQESVSWSSSGEQTKTPSPVHKIRITPRGFAAIAREEIEAPPEVQGLLGRLAEAIARWRNA